MPGDVAFLEFEPPDPARIDDPHYWLVRAYELRVKADRACDPEAKAKLAYAAETYEGLAAWALKYCGRLH
jgi:hypothetical protein